MEVLMEAPPIEQLTRLALALVMTGAFILLSAMTRLVWDKPSRWVALFMAAILGVYTAWRWFILWLGTQDDEALDHAQMANFTVVGNVLLIAVILAVVCMAYHHVRELRKGRNP